MKYCNKLRNQTARNSQGGTESSNTAVNPTTPKAVLFYSAFKKHTNTVLPAGYITVNINFLNSV